MVGDKRLQRPCRMSKPCLKSTKNTFKDLKLKSDNLMCISERSSRNCIKDALQGIGLEVNASIKELLYQLNLLSSSAE